MSETGVVITHPEREVYADMGLTKQQLADYYELVAPLMLPHIRGRPLSLVRCPDGQGGQCFFQKHWPAKGGAPITTKLVAEDTGDPEPYAFATTPRDLVALVQHGVMETHIWGSRYDALERPDRLVLDLDPGPGLQWRAVKQAALQTRALMDALGLQSWVKLTGGKGMHIVVPIERRVEWETLGSFARAVAERLVRDSPKLFVSKAAKDIRNKKIFVDWMRNARGATFVAPWSPRARPGAPVSLPLEWDALDSVTAPNMFSIPVVTKRIAKEGPLDPWKNMLGFKQRLTPDMAVQLAEGA